MPELFHHQHRFLGRLAVRRVRRLGPSVSASAECAPPDAPRDLLLVTHAWHDERLGRCPALASDGRCSIHTAGKPLVCSLAPLDALLPDAWQRVVLAARTREAAFLGADCIAAGERPGFVPLVRRLHVIEPEAQALLARRRAELVLEKRHWGTGVFRLLVPELFAKPEMLAKIPPDGYLSLSVAPVLMVLADISEACRKRCIEYLEAQLALARTLGAEHVVRGHDGLRDALAQRGTRDTLDRDTAAATEAWLGLEQAA